MLVYLIFLFLQSILYTTNSFEHSVPWGGFESNIALLRIVKSFVLAAAFVFNKSGSYRGEINLVCLALDSIIVYRLYKDAIIFKASVFYATIIYEGLFWWLFLTVAIHVLSGSILSTTSLSVLIFTGFLLSCILVTVQLIKKEHLSVADDFEKYDQPLDLMIYFFRLYKLIENNDPSAQVILQGRLRKHATDCVI